MAARRHLLPLLAAALVAAAGCTAPADQPGASVAGDHPALEGFVLDDGFRPLAGANVTIGTAHATATTDSAGHYEFAQLADDRSLVVVARMEGYTPLGKSVAVSAGNHTMLNFTLVPTPTMKPYLEKQEHKGFLACRAVASTGSANLPFDCGVEAVGANDNVWDFNLQGNVAGIVVEIVWSANTQAATYLNATLETVGLGDQDAVLSQVEGPSALRAQVTNLQALRYYPSGGSVRLVVDAASGAADQEQAAAAGLAIQQDYQVIASIFYVAPPDPTYSAVA